jgi:hypothetical protein
MPALLKAYGQGRSTMVSYARISALAAAVAALIAGAVALWLSAAAPTRAATADQVQGTAVTVADKTITWGTTPLCTQTMGTADFGLVLPGASAQSSSFNGCVTSSASGWGVTASATELTGPVGSAPIPNGNLKIRTTGASGSAGPAAGAMLPCGTATATCSLDTTRTLVSGAGAGTGGFAYAYSLGVPAAAAGGAYTGTVTFTASN